MRIFNPNNETCSNCKAKGNFSAVVNPRTSELEDIICNYCKQPMDKNIWNQEMSEKVRLSSLGIKELDDILDKMSEEEVKKVVTDKYECKVCKQSVIPSEMLEHFALVHNDKDASDLLEKLNKFRGT